MEREIKFRGWFQGIDGYEYWAFGYLVKQSNGNWEITNGETSWTVDSVGQYTGLKDKNGVEIYEGDICKVLYTDWPSNPMLGLSQEDYINSISHNAIVEYDTPSFVFRPHKEFTDSMHVGAHGYIEVIGNIHQNPELI